MLPFSMRAAIIASAITCFSHTVTLSICLASTVAELEPLVWQVRQMIVHAESQTYTQVNTGLLKHTIYTTSCFYGRCSRDDSALSFPFWFSEGLNDCFTALLAAAQGLVSQNKTGKAVPCTIKNDEVQHFNKVWVVKQWTYPVSSWHSTFSKASRVKWTAV